MRARCLSRVIECCNVCRMASVPMYTRNVDNRSIVVCGGNKHPNYIASCEELPIDARGLPAASSWRSFASLPTGMELGCMLQVNGAVCLCPVAFFK